MHTSVHELKDAMGWFSWGQFALRFHISLFSQVPLCGEEPEVSFWVYGPRATSSHLATGVYQAPLKS